MTDPYLAGFLVVMAAGYLALYCYLLGRRDGGREGWKFYNQQRPKIGYLGYLEAQIDRNNWCRDSGEYEAKWHPTEAE